jgi:hypothetical protein
MPCSLFRNWMAVAFVSTSLRHKRHMNQPQVNTWANDQGKHPSRPHVDPLLLLTMTLVRVLAMIEQMIRVDAIDSIGIAMMGETATMDETAMMDGTLIATMAETEDHPIMAVEVEEHALALDPVPAPTLVPLCDAPLTDTVAPVPAPALDPALALLLLVQTEEEEEEEEEEAVPTCVAPMMHLLPLALIAMKSVVIPALDLARPFSQEPEQEMKPR